jgi:hypothetical protein
MDMELKTLMRFFEDVLRTRTQLRLHEVTCDIDAIWTNVTAGAATQL